MPKTARRVLALIVCAWLAVACTDEASSPPGRLVELLEMVPAAVAQDRALYYTDLRVARGFSSVLPLAASGSVLGAAPDAFTDVLETGGQPLTLLAGDVDPEEVTRAVQARGYRATRDGDWVRFARDDDVPAGAPPLVTAVPAGAVSDGILVLGAGDDVEGVVRGRPSPPWAGRLAAAVGEAAAIAFDGREDPFAQAARRAGTDAAGLLDQHGVTGELGRYRAAALAWNPRGQFDGRPAPAGVVALALPAGADGHEAAAALAIRAATAAIAGDGRRLTHDILEGGAPRFDDAADVVRLPVRWHEFDAGRLRRDLDAGNLLFLAPGGRPR